MSESPSLSIFSQRSSDSGFTSVVEPSPNLPSNRWIKRSVNQFFQPRPLLLMPATGSATGGLFLLMIPPSAAKPVPTAPPPSGDDAFRRAKRDSFCAFCVFCGSNSNLLVFMNGARCLAVELCPDTICQVPAKNSMTVLSPVPPTAIKAVAQGARLNTLAGKSIAIVGGSFMANVTHPELKRLILKEYPNTRCA